MCELRYNADKNNHGPLLIKKLTKSLLEIKSLSVKNVAQIC